jgi:DNA (cytosine-5)-methyltransferase 1
MQNKEIRFMSVCSGIEAASVAWHPLGWRAVAFAEIDKAASAVLAHHYPDVPNLGDFTNVDTRKLGRVDVLAGGTPCQAFSIAGARASLADARGNLTLAFVGLAHELAGFGKTAGNGLRNVVWENVPGVLSTVDNAFGCFLGGLVGADGAFVPLERKPADGKSTRWWRWSQKDKAHAVAWPRAGMVSGPKGRAAWVVKDAQFFGLAQRRERVLVVADFGNGADPAAVLFERVGMQGNSAPSREKGEGVAGTIAGGARASGYSTDDIPLTAQALLAKGNSSHDDSKETYISVAYAPEIARCVATREGNSQDFESTTMVAQVYSMMPQNSGKDFKARPVEVAQPLMAAGPSHGNQGGDVVCMTGQISHALTAGGHDASEDGSGRRAPIIAFTAKDYGADAQEDIAPTLRAGGHKDSHQNGGVGPAIAFAQNQRDEVREMNIAGSLAAQPGTKQQTYVAQTVALRGREGGGTAELGGSDATALRASSGGGDKPHVLCADVAPTLGKESHSPTKASSGQAVDFAIATTSAVRRLTPRECERLQGFQFLCGPDYPGAWQDDAGRWWSPDYTRIPVRRYKEPKITKTRPADMWSQIDGEWWLMAADGPRYKQLGNSWAVPKFRWLGARLQRLLPASAPTAANDNNDNNARQQAVA